uniref:C-CAP/cofactor C-like domain-containing protein n=1 Tax=Trichuris muris TaxID=70415 RepID=A0A5S6Q909_TRIMR
MTEAFEKQFYAARDQLANDVEQAAKGKGAEDKVLLADVHRRLQDMRIMIQESAPTISKYELAKARTAVVYLEKLIHTKLLKDAKLVFNTVDFDQVEQKSHQTEEPKKLDEVESAASILAKHSYKADGPASISDRSNEELLLDNLKINHVVKLTKLNQCHVRVVSVVGAATFKELTDCTIICCPVVSSFSVTKCERCTFVAACQQLRIHDSTSCQFYVHVTTCGTVEGCSKIGIAPYEVTMKNKDERFAEAGLDMHTNNWTDIKDFNNPFCVGQSPSWFVIDEAAREKFTLD